MNIKISDLISAAVSNEEKDSLYWIISRVLEHKMETNCSEEELGEITYLQAAIREMGKSIIYPEDPSGGQLGQLGYWSGEEVSR